MEPRKAIGEGMVAVARYASISWVGKCTTIEMPPAGADLPPSSRLALRNPLIKDV